MMLQSSGPSSRMESSILRVAINSAVYWSTPSGISKVPLIISMDFAGCLLTVVVRDVAEQFACVTGADLGMSLDKAEARVALVDRSDLGMSLDKAEARA